MTIFKEWRITQLLIVCAAFCVMVNGYSRKSTSEGEGLSESQDVRSLDRRISSIEQRLYSIEVNISRLDRATISQPPVSSPRDPEVNLLRGEIQTLQLRLNELECGLVKLDERTAAPNRQSRPRSGATPSDPCRLNPGAPLRLSTRPGSDE